MLITPVPNAIAALDDPFGRGWSLLGLPHHWVSFGFLHDRTGVLLIWAAQRIGEDIDARLFSFAARSLLLSILAALLVTVTAMLLAYLQRLHRDRLMQSAVRLSLLGYAIPGTVLAVGFFIRSVRGGYCCRGGRRSE